VLYTFTNESDGAEAQQHSTRRHRQHLWDHRVWRRLRPGDSVQTGHEGQIQSAALFRGGPEGRRWSGQANAGCSGRALWNRRSGGRREKLDPLQTGGDSLREQVFLFRSICRDAANTHAAELGYKTRGISPRFACFRFAICSSENQTATTLPGYCWKTVITIFMAPRCTEETNPARDFPDVV
jgi:hypothetical protein